MAHYLAELIEDAEISKIEERPAKLATCATAILALWERRHLLPNGKRPFEDLEPILRALDSLDPIDKKNRYFQAPRMAAAEDELSTETRSWLEFADCLDNSAKILIRYCLTQAAQTALDKSKDWVKLAENAGLEKGIDIQVIRIIAHENELTQAREPDDTARKILEDRLNQLDVFRKTADTLASDLRRQLKQSKMSKKRF